MKTASLASLVLLVGCCEMRNYLIETRDIRSETFNTRNTEYGNNYNDYYTDYQAGMHIEYKALYVCF